MASSPTSSPGTAQWNSRVAEGIYGQAGPFLVHHSKLTADDGICVLILIIYFILFYLFMAVLGLCSTPRLSLVEAVGAALPCTVRGFSLRCPLLLQSRALEDVGFSSCGA